MEHLKKELEALDDAMFELEDKIGLADGNHKKMREKQAEMLRLSSSREASVLAVAQKVASRLDQAIHHVEQVLRD
jgi:hypothetical protein